jgi:hypothetical protein
MLTQPPDTRVRPRRPHYDVIKTIDLVEGDIVTLLGGEKSIRELQGLPVDPKCRESGRLLVLDVRTFEDESKSVLVAPVDADSQRLEGCGTFILTVPLVLRVQDN